MVGELLMKSLSPRGEVTPEKKAHYMRIGKNPFWQARNLFKVIVMAVITPAPPEHLRLHPRKFLDTPVPLRYLIVSFNVFEAFPDYLHCALCSVSDSQ